MKMFLICYNNAQTPPECSISNDDPWFNEDFIRGKRIDNLHNLPIRYNADRSSVDTDYPYCSKWFLISKRFATVLKTLTTNYQEFPSVIYRKDRLISDDFVSFVFTESYPAIDMKKSIYKKQLHGVIFGPDKIVLSKKKLADVPDYNKIFRLQDVYNEIIVSEAGKKAIEKAGITGLEFEELEVV